MLERRTFPIDLMLLVFLAGGVILTIQVVAWDERALGVALIVAYLIVHALGDLLGRKSEKVDMQNWALLAKVAIVLALVAFFVLLPEIRVIRLRHESRPLDVIDGVIQVEEAIKFLLNGQDPYHMNYLNTPLAQWGWGHPYPNPALYYLVYPPFTVLVGVPAYLISMATVGWYDQRFVYIVALMVALFAFYRLGKDRSRSLAALLVVGLNPLTVPFLIDGRNDILTLALIGLSLLALSWRREPAGLILAALLFGVACATKQSAWLLAPFYLYYVYARLPGPNRDRSRKVALMWVLPAAGAFIVLVGPFLIWDPRGLVDGLIAFPSGNVTYNYPIDDSGSYGFHVVLRSPRVWSILDQLSSGPGAVLRPLAQGLEVKNYLDYYPFWIFQVLFALPVLIIALLRQRRTNNIATAITGYAVLLLTYQYFARFFHDNYFGFFSAIFALALLIKDPLSDPREGGEVAGTAADRPV